MIDYRGRKRWPFNTGDCLIEVTTWAGLTFFLIQQSDEDDSRATENTTLKSASDVTGLQSGSGVNIQDIHGTMTTVNNEEDSKELKLLSHRIIDTWQNKTYLGPQKYYFYTTANILRSFFCLMVFNATFNNISVISWRSVLLMEKTGGPGENHRPVTSHWQTLSHNVVHHISVLGWYYVMDLCCFHPHVNKFVSIR